MLRLLVIDRNESVRETIKNFLASHNFQTFTAVDLNDGYRVLDENMINVLLLNVDSCDDDILEVLDSLARFHPDLAIILTGSGSDPSIAVAALKEGAIDYLVKPLDLQRLVILLEKIESPSEESDEQPRVEAKQRIWRLDELKSENAEFQEIINVSFTYAHTNIPILIFGPTGSGKNILARAIHNESTRHSRPFIEINCPAIPDNLFESELFGYEAGAFTDAVKTKKGIMELANKGTIFFDEIGDMTGSMQSRLLKVIDEKKFHRLGGNREISIDIRIIASTNHDLKEMVQMGTFREDLYYRLAVVTITIPPLKSHPEDIIPLAGKLIDDFCISANLSAPELSYDAQRALAAYDWPGNIRELRNTIERVLITHQGNQITLKDLPERISGIKPIEITSYSEPGDILPLDELERRHIIKILERVGGNRDKAAKILGIARSTLFEKLKKYGLTNGD